MKKINFTEGDLNNLKNLIADFILEGSTFKGQVGTQISIYDLVHNTSINTLKRLFASLQSCIKNQELTTLRWDSDNKDDQATVAVYKQITFIELLIGYKMHLAQSESIELQKLRLKEQIEKVQNSIKTPGDILKELETQLAELG